MVDWTECLEFCRRIHISQAKRKDFNLLVCEHVITLPACQEDQCRVLDRRNHREKSAFLTANDFDIISNLLLGTYDRSRRKKNLISKVARFFNFNALSSLNLFNVNFDTVLTMIAMNCTPCCPKCSWDLKAATSSRPAGPL